MVATHACKKAIFFKRLCSNIGFHVGQITISYDNQSVIFLVKNPTFHVIIKKIDVQFYFVRDMVEDRKVKLEKVDTLMNVANRLESQQTLISSNGVQSLWASQPLAIKSYF